MEMIDNLNLLYTFYLFRSNVILSIMERENITEVCTKRLKHRINSFAKELFMNTNLFYNIYYITKMIKKSFSDIIRNLNKYFHMH